MLMANCRNHQFARTLLTTTIFLLALFDAVREFGNYDA